MFRKLITPEGRAELRMRDQAYKLWSNLAAVKDFPGDAIKSMAKFGQPKPL